MEDFDYKSFQAKALEQLKAGKPLLGKDGAFAPLLENLLNAALEGEMDVHMDEEERLSGNRRNSYNRKQVQTSWVRLQFTHLVTGIPGLNRSL